MSVCLRIYLQLSMKRAPARATREGSKEGSCKLLPWAMRRGALLLCMVVQLAVAVEVNGDDGKPHRRMQTACTSEQQTRLESLDATLDEQENGSPATARAEALDAMKSVLVHPDELIIRARKVNALGPLR